jgi:hypothetical protein
MKILLLLAVVFIETEAIAQFRSESFTHYTLAPNTFAAPMKTIIPGLLSDPVRNYKVGSPLMTSYSSWNWNAQNTFFWTGIVTTQSFNKGKFGTLYYWDVQGNLRGTRGFIDISGKNKRGFKLVFPWKMFR